MRKMFVFGALVALCLLIALPADAAEKEQKNVPPALNFKMKSLAGKDVDLSKYQGRVLLIVNVASQCGLTPQYKELQALHEKYTEKGLSILGFPCNQFGKQEPGSADEIRAFCSVNYGVTFDMFARIEVNGEEACGLYKYMTALDTKPKEKGSVSWNFEKFVIGRDGEVLARLEPRTKPDDPALLKLIEAELAKPTPK